MRHRVTGRVFLGTLALLGVLCLTPSVSGAATTPPSVVSHVTMFSDPGDYIGGGASRYFVAGTDAVSMSGDASSLAVDVSGGPYGDYYTLTFAAAPGQTLHPGLYTNAQRTPFRQAGHPGIDIYGTGRGCNTVGGRFDVKDIATTRKGEVTRLWLTYEQHCENGLPALFGEVQIALPATDIVAVPDHVWWPDTALGATGTTEPLRFLNRGTSTVAVASASLAGVGSDSFTVGSDGCTGNSFGPGAGCVVYVRFVPATAGPRTARLTLSTSTGATAVVQLDGAGVGGDTSLTMASDPGDFVGAGVSYGYTPTNASFGVSGSRQGVHGTIDASDGSRWSLDFVPSSGDILTTGTTYTATRYPFNGTGAGMSISGQGRGCNTLTGTFTVNEISTDLDGLLQSVSITFEQHCEGAAAALRGTLDYRVPAGDTTPPGSVSGLSAKRAADRQHVTVSWANPGDSDLAFVVVRYLLSSDVPGSPNGSLFGYAGTATSMSLTVGSKTPVTVVVWAVDSAGNVSPPVTASLR